MSVLYVETVTVYECQECGETMEPGNELSARLYLCGECGATWNSDAGHSPVHKCEDCGKFGQKVTDGPLCSSCEEGELNEIDAYDVYCKPCDVTERVEAGTPEYTCGSCDATVALP